MTLLPKIPPICISPAGHPYFSYDTDYISADNIRNDNSGEMNRICNAFELSYPNGFLYLAATALETVLPAELDFFRRFAKLYLKNLCHLPILCNVSEIIVDLPTVAMPSIMELELFLINVPPITGAEYITSDVLTEWWTTLDEFVHKQISLHPSGAIDWIRSQNPLWRTVGRVTFHLAENKRDELRPFAFMATYTDNISHNVKPVQLPLSKALKEYSSLNDRSALLRLLQPISLASEKCRWVKTMLDNQTIYSPRAWTPQQAYQMLQDIPLLEECGLIVRVPDWWKSRRTSRPQVQVSVGTKADKKFLRMDSLLEFNINTALDGETLTENEIKELLNTDSSIVRLRGQWVEVDSSKLREALEHWQNINSLIKEKGISFYEGMRLISGVPIDSKWDETNKESEFREWSEVLPVGTFAEILTAIRNPANSQLYDIAFDKIGLNAVLRPYQETGVRWLQLTSQLGLGACLADDMGLGKTIQVITLLLIFKTYSDWPKEIKDVKDIKNVKDEIKDDVKDEIKEIKEFDGGGRCDDCNGSCSLLVAPASLLGNWESEIKKFAPSLRIYIAHSSGNGTAKPNNLNKIDLLITTYGMIERIDWLKSNRWRTIILDEAQAIKNAGTRQAKAIKELQTNGRIILTGTPIENRLLDLWSLFDFLNPGLLGTISNFKKFIKSISDKDSTSNLAALRKLTQPYILRRLKTDKRIISDLPDKTEITAWCNLTKKQAVLYSQSVAMLAKELQENTEGIKRRGLILSYLMRFKQICNHPSQWLGDNNYDPDLSGKFGRLSEICEEIAARQEKVIIFTQFREITEHLAAFLQNIFHRSGFILDGSTPIKKRREMVETFQKESGVPFFILSLKAGGTGLNLTSASHVVHFDRWWNPAVENQATDRAFRIGQKKNVLVHKFVCRGTIEERIDTMIESKKMLADKVVEDAGDTILITEMNDKQLLEMVSLDINRAQIL
ncbi:MAG: DEAD/DEAH box helicase [Planctomycetaceae bacterium]|jgi:non-specific serine/threonine protein kinase|nr:DEAD/DEAH box helicase [Planctomycetaceae bacterium]